MTLEHLGVANLTTELKHQKTELRSYCEIPLQCILVMPQVRYHIHAISRLDDTILVHIFQHPYCCEFSPRTDIFKAAIK